MNELQKRTDLPALVAGSLLIAFGVLFLLGEVGAADVGPLFRTYWPLIIVAVGLPKLFRPSTLWGGLWLMAIGAWLQAIQLHWHDLTYRNSWPLLLIVFGAGVILRTIVGSLTPRGAEDIEERHEP